MFESFILEASKCIQNCVSSYWSHIGQHIAHWGGPAQVDFLKERSLQRVTTTLTEMEESSLLWGATGAEISSRFVILLLKIGHSVGFVAWGHRYEKVLLHPPPHFCLRFFSLIFAAYSPGELFLVFDGCHRAQEEVVGLKEIQGKMTTVSL